MKMGSMTLSIPEEGSLYWTLFSVLTLPVHEGNSSAVLEYRGIAREAEERRATTRVTPTMEELNVNSLLVRRSLRRALVYLRSGHE